MSRNTPEQAVTTKTRDFTEYIHSKREALRICSGMSCGIVANALMESGVQFGKNRNSRFDMLPLALEPI